MHVCIPYSKDFIDQVTSYQLEYKPKFTVIHSTVPAGVSRVCKAVHSPVIGIHPFLEKSLTTFTKYLGGKESYQVADYFRKAGMKVYIFEKQETTELMKILDTTNYGVEIEFAKEVKRICDKNGIPFEAWTLWVRNYNEGYTKLGYPEYVKPNLVPIDKKIGGHCVVPNAYFLESKFSKLIQNENK